MIRMMLQNWSVFLKNFSSSSMLQVTMESKPSAIELMSRTPEDIVMELGGVYEHSAWVAEEFSFLYQHTKSTPIISVTDLATAMKVIVDASSNEKKLELLRLHPDLCEKFGKLSTLTKDSQEEQSRSGLQSLTEQEIDTFTINNGKYRKKFGFPFILAVRNATKHTVLAALAGRVDNTPETEFATALLQVHKIAWMRLLSKLDTSSATGFLTCHVLDTANGCPGKKVKLMNMQRSCPLPIEWVLLIIRFYFLALWPFSRWYENRIAPTVSLPMPHQRVCHKP